MKSISLENVLDWTQKSSELISTNREYLAFSHCFNTCLSACVFNQSYFSKKLSLFVFEYYLVLAFFRIMFLSHKISFDNKIKSISNITFLHDILVSLKYFIFEGITQLLFLFILNLR
jgi:hypothetical protein